MKSTWRHIPHEWCEGDVHLALNRWFLTQALPVPLFRFYSWAKPCFSYGYFQKMPEIHDGFPTYRRMTGGGVVLHDQDLSFMLVYPRASSIPWSVRRSYEAIHQVIQEALLHFGISTERCNTEAQGMFCFQHPTIGDLLRNGEKVVGGAQRRMGNHLLHEGTLDLSKLNIPRMELMDVIRDCICKKFECTFENDLRLTEKARHSIRREEVFTP